MNVPVPEKKVLSVLNELNFSLFLILTSQRPPVLQREVDAEVS